MDKKMIVQVVSGALAVILVISLTLMVMRKIPTLYFWVVAIITALVAYVVIPKINK